VAPEASGQKGRVNVGFVKRNTHIFLLTTLDKAGHAPGFQYKDHFVSPTDFEWQSQNRTSQASADGQDIQKHAERGLAVHLFVRHQKKLPGGGSAPFLLLRRCRVRDVERRQADHGQVAIA
jgi:uncharacterized protein DUF3427